MYILGRVRTKTNRIEIIVSKFEITRSTLESGADEWGQVTYIEAQPGSAQDTDELVLKVRDGNTVLSPKEAKALAKYLNSWAGFEEAGTFSSGITIQGFDEEKVRRAVEKQFEKARTQR
jgi:hypothetical protein